MKIRFLSLILMLLLFISAVMSLSVYAPERVINSGDIDVNREVNNSDRTVLLRYLPGWSLYTALPSTATPEPTAQLIWNDFCTKLKDNSSFTEYMEQTALQGSDLNTSKLNMSLEYSNITYPIKTASDSHEDIMYTVLYKDLSFASKYDGQTPSSSSSAVPATSTSADTHAAKSLVEVSEYQNISQTSGMNASGNGIHSGHQTRICRTEYGIYATYIYQQTSSMNYFTIVKINKDGTSKSIYTNRFPFDTSSVNIMRDDNGDIYVAVIPVDKITNSHPETAWLAMYHVNPKTDAVTEYMTKKQFAVASLHGYGYSQPIIDKVQRKIYAFYSGGDCPGDFAWIEFNMDTKTWGTTWKNVQTPYRYCYHYAYADGKGGVCVVTERDIKVEVVGHPEIKYANYVWDQLALFIIPDMTKEEYSMIIVEDADYSKVGENKYPSVLNNSYGDTFLDADGYLHVLYASRYYSLPGGKIVEATQWHAVYDGSTLLFKKELEFQNDYNMRMAQAADGSLYIIAISKSRPQVVEIWKANDVMGHSFSCDKKYQFSNEVTSNVGLSASGPRNNSYNDNVIDCLFATKASGKYNFNHFTVTLP